MTAEQQKRSVEIICDTLKIKLLERVEGIPFIWDETKIRHWIGDFYDEHFRKPLELRNPHLRDYKKDLIINDLIK